MKLLPRLSLRHECLKIGLAVMAVSFYNQSNRPEESLTKCKLIYWRILDIVFKLDCLPASDSGLTFLNL